MSETIFIKGKKVYAKPMRMRIGGNPKIGSSNYHPKRCKSFAGIVNFLNLFCSELQESIKPIYYLTQTGKEYLK